ncbi:FAD:protein FMN transferase [Nocardia macrotermitis]|uniref:FAD:protein FMN transferase n=1 Tax=Nocardia macrotermitis TaxID=2585198 RepID=A0A7K0DA98_9NOCA|nr:FAD:protein FMN transferase [Nocardia macrotermitis]MQY22700.1 FAD:protein FMN transferase [Nocardia macrotermitis]
MTGTRAAVSASTTLSAIGTTVVIVCTDARELAFATRLVRARLDELDRAASRFRHDSELWQINCRSVELARTDDRGSLRVTVGWTLGSCLRAAMRVERQTEGLVCASLGTMLAACGYDDDLDAVRARGATGASGPAGDDPAPCAAATFDEERWQVTVPAGTMLDLGASAKAWAADALATELAARYAGGFLVNLGGDIATGGVPPDGGWAVGVQDWEGGVQQVVRSTGQAFATSSTRLRTWTHRGSTQHHIIDPRTGRPARTRWAQVTCAGPDAVQANAASTAAIILDERAPGWLAERGVPARLSTAEHEVTTTPGWPAPAGGVRQRAS